MSKKGVITLITNVILNGSEVRISRHSRHEVARHNADADFIRALIDVDANVLDDLLTTDERGFCIDDLIKKQMPALHFATIFRRSDVMKVLLKHGANVDLQNEEGQTCLLLAVQDVLQDDTVEQVRKILRHVDVGDGRNKAKLMEPFLRNGRKNQKSIKMLFADKPYKNEGILYDDDNFESRTLLVELLLSSGANPNIRCQIGNSPLSRYFSLRKKDPRILDLLLKHGADVNVKPQSGITAIWHALHRGTAEMVAKLLDAGADVHDLETGRMPLDAAVGNANDEEAVKIIKLLVKRGERVNDFQEESSTALQTAVECGSLAKVKCLLSLGADPNLYDRSSDCEEYACGYFLRPPLFVAVEHAYHEVAECLINHGADVFYVDSNGATLLDAAMMTDNLNHIDNLYCVAMLMERGATIDENDDRNLDSEKMKFLKSCQRELEVLKNTKIHANVSITYFEFLWKRDTALVRCLRNENIAAAMKSGDYEKRFVYFAKRLAANYERGLIQMEMVDKLRSILSEAFQDVLPEEVIFMISDYFNLEDLNKCFENERGFN